jgi:hypothetical protein
MSDLCQRLQEVNVAGVFRLTCPLAILEANIVLADFALVDVNLSAVQGKGEFLAELAKALNAPEWFGHNWDALADVLGDLPAAAGYVLLLRQGGENFGLSATDYESVMEIFNETVVFWRAQGKPFWVFFSDER